MGNAGQPYTGVPGSAETAATGLIARVQASLADRYTIGRELGRGGMAHVYLARDLRHERDVAIKILRPDLAAGLGVERFLREIRIEAALQHPHILGLIDSGAIEAGAGRVPYYVMPYIPGETLRELMLKEKQLPFERAVQIAREVADALDYAHSHGFVHRDIKPGNILLSGGHAWVADFGIARAVTMAAGEELTEAGLAIGTPDYMSPEQASGDTGIDGRSDIYALGCVVYELLAGEPPFRGRTAQAILARHRHEPPPALRVLRPGVSRAAEAAVEKALAKVAADRFESAAEFVRALEGETGTRSAMSSPGSSRRRWAAGVVTAGLLGLGAVAISRKFAEQRFSDLNPNRVVVFPLSDPAQLGTNEGSGEAVATYIGYALEGTAPLRWLEGWDFLNPVQRSNIGVLSAAAAREISRHQRAGFYLDGAIVRSPDSITVVLRLHDVKGDSLLRRAGASTQLAGASLPQLGLRAISGVLPALLQAGGQVDLSALSEREPGAIANFLQGEREYRRMRFGAALEHYKSAVGIDSGLAFAGLKGALAANWEELPGDAQSLLDAALERRQLLPRKYRSFAAGLSAYLGGEADSAVRYLRQTLDIDSTWSEAWMVLGEAHYHLIPSGGHLDSLAEAAFNEARRFDPEFTPALYHLVEIALRRGDAQRAGALMAGLKEARTDGTRQTRLSLMLDCVRKGPNAVDWARAAAQSPTEVLIAAQLASSGVAQPGCAQAAYDAVLHAGAIESRWGALLGLQSMLVAQGRHSDLRSLLGSSLVADLPARKLLLWDATADSVLNRDADGVAASIRQPFDSMSSPNLWLLGQWAAHRRSAEKLRDISAVLGHRAKRGTRVDSLLARVFDAHVAALMGDTNGAIQRLRELTPEAPIAELMWQPWEALAGERLLLAQLLLAQKRFSDAYQAAEGLENDRAIAFLIYLPASLRVRAQAAEGVGNPGLARHHRNRLVMLHSAVSVPAGHLKSR